MTKRVDLGDFVEAFLGEAEDLLRALSANLLTIEAGLREGRQNPRALREAFRATHTLKGLAAMVAIEPIVAIAHRMESLLRAADAAGGRMLPAADLLLGATRELERRVETVAKGKPAQAPPPELIERLDALERPEADDAGRAPRLALDPAIAGKLGHRARAARARRRRGSPRTARGLHPVPREVERRGSTSRRCVSG